jgi:hypothetical protein
MVPAKESSIVTSSRREAIVALLMWIAAMSYTVGYCAWKGYHGTTDDLKFVLGFPEWVFWGVMAPWTACTVCSWFYAFVFMKDECLEEPAEVPTGDSEDEEAGHV